MRDTMNEDKTTTVDESFAYRINVEVCVTLRSLM